MADEFLKDFFAGAAMTRLMNSPAIKSEIPSPLPAALYRRSGNGPVGLEVTWDEVRGHRQLAQLVNQNSPSRSVQLPGVTKRYATGLGAKENFTLKIDLLQALKSDVPMVREGARREVVRQLRDFRQRFDNLRVSLVHSVFALGAIYADKDGNVLHSSSGAATPPSVDFNVPTGNKLTHDGAGSTYNIGDWSNASTNIAAACRTIRNANLKANSYQLTTVMYGQNVPDYLATNTMLKDYFKEHPAVRQSMVTDNVIPDGTLGFNWKPVETAFFADATGTAREWFGGDYLAFTPDISTDWYENFPCGTLYPIGTASPGMSLDQMIALCGVAYGYFSYAEMSTDPLVAKIIAGDYGLPVIKVPGTYYFGRCKAA